MKGSSFERTLGNLDAVEVDLLRLAPPSLLKGALPSVEAHVNRFLPKHDPRRVAVNEVAATNGAAIDEEQRSMLVAAQHAANTQRRRDLIRLRGFRNLLVGGIVIFTLLAVALAWIGYADPTAIPLCFSPENGGVVKIVCPRGEKPVGEVTRSSTAIPPSPIRSAPATSGWSSSSASSRRRWPPAGRCASSTAPRRPTPCRSRSRP